MTTGQGFLLAFVIAIVLDLIIFFPEFGKDSKQVVFVFFYSNVDNPFFIILIDYIWDNRWIKSKEMVKIKKLVKLYLPLNL